MDDLFYECQPTPKNCFAKHINRKNPIAITLCLFIPQSNNGHILYPYTTNSLSHTILYHTLICIDFHYLNCETFLLHLYIPT